MGYRVYRLPAAVEGRLLRMRARDCQARGRVLHQGIVPLR